MCYANCTTNSGVIAEKPSEDLFTLDIIGSEAIQTSYNKIHKPLKADQILAQRSAVPAIDSRKRAGVTDGILEPSTKRKKVNGVSAREYDRLKNRAYGGEAVAKDIVEADSVPVHDPWAQTIEVDDPRFSYLEKPKSVRAPRSLKEDPISLLHGSKVMPAVARPKPGTSYNPSFKDWDQLLTEEGQKEVESEKKRIRERKAEEEHLARVAAAEKERDNLLTEDESAWEGIESEYEGSEWLRKRRPERKTPAERNKVKKRKEAERLVKHDAEMKRRAQQALRIKDIARQVNAKGNANAITIVENRDSSDDEVDDRVLRRRKLGKSAYALLLFFWSGQLLLMICIDCQNEIWNSCYQTNYKIRYAC